MTDRPVLRFTIQGPPVPKERPRLGRGGARTPERTREYEQNGACAATLAVAALPGWRTDWAEYALTVRVYRAEARGDLDNFIKTADCMNGIVFHDDAAVRRIDASMQQDKENPRLEFTVEMIGDVARKIPKARADNAWTAEPRTRKPAKAKVKRPRKAKRNAAPPWLVAARARAASK